MAGLPFLDRFKKDIAKLDTVSVGIPETNYWLSTGNFALNRALSGDFKKGIPLAKITLFAGPSGSGKSFIAGNVTKQAQVQGYHVVYLDSEHAIDVDYLGKIGCSIDPEHLTYISVATIEDVNAILSEFFSSYKKQYGKNNQEAPKTLIVLDSLAMLSSTTEMENYEKAGIIKGDQGQLAKRRKAMLRLAVGQIGTLPISMVVTDHVYPQDIMMGDGAWAITNSTKFSCSIIGIVTKLKLKDEGEVVGVRMRFETYKSRFAKLGTKVELEVPYNKGMSPCTGLLELLEEMKVIAKGTQPGEKLNWVSEWTDEKTGEVKKVSFREKDFNEEVALQLLDHPLCQPLAARGGPEPTADEIDTIVDQDEQPTTAVKKRGKKE
jgi:RecA/RadA recombinase